VEKMTQIRAQTPLFKVKYRTHYRRTQGQT